MGAGADFSLAYDDECVETKTPQCYRSKCQKKRCFDTRNITRCRDVFAAGAGGSRVVAAEAQPDADAGQVRGGGKVPILSRKETREKTSVPAAPVSEGVPQNPLDPREKVCVGTHRGERCKTASVSSGF